ncbi:MAG: hypothetical protein FJY54_10490 [Betaproteobacteria bacterium]|nr:hypothetical protein [Betaproteobacteria bacterium]
MTLTHVTVTVRQTAASPVLTVPNAITLLRVLLIPLIAYCIVSGAYGAAFAGLMAAGASDLLDGFIARRLKQFSRIGAMLDPLADKLTILTAVVLLAWHELIPVWLAAAIVVRDAVIVSGAVAYHFVVGRVEIAPTPLSKVNTFLEFGVVAAVLASAAEIVDAGSALPVLFLVLLLTVAGSGLQYVWVWGWKAARKTQRAA